MMRPGVRIGIDVGDVRVGVASSDPQALVATPVQTLPRDHEHLSDVDQICLWVQQRAAIELVVGLPRSLSGEEGMAAAGARRYAKVLRQRLDGVPVRLWDERLTTVDARRTLRASGVPGRRQRESVDQVAAVLILQAAIDSERNTGVPGGEVVGARKPRRAPSRDPRHGRQP